jgi:hypothetical protein
MKRTYWIIGLVILILAIIGGVAYALFFASPPASAPTVNNTTVTQPLKMYMVAVDDNGKSGDLIGCGDSAVSVTTEDVTTSDVIKATMERLLANKKQYYGESGLYNALYKSSLTYISSSVSGDTVTVKLSGTFSLGGECDNPRVQAQLEQTAKAAASVTKVAIFVNDKPLDEVLSLK